MVDITHKSNTLRAATAQALVEVGSEATIKAIKNGQVPKGDVFSMSKAVGLLGVKNTPLILADCHPIPIEFTGVDYEINGLTIKVLVTVKTIYKTGVEVEAMHGASVVALNMYDMLKPIDKGVVIREVKLLEKYGGKSNFQHKFKNTLQAAVVVCSDSIFSGQKEDKAGKAIVEKLKNCDVKIHDYEVIPDEIKNIQQRVDRYNKDEVDMLIFTGGTGLSSRDRTPEAILPLLDRRIQGVEEVIRRYGQDRMPYAMLSRSVAGVIDNMLVLALPGSTNGAKESMDAIFPAVLHVFGILKGARHD